MASVFDRLAPRLDAAVEVFRGEPLRLVPMAGGRISDAALDPDRAPVEGVVGRIGVEPVVDRLFAERRAGRTALGQSEQAGTKLVLKLSAAALAALPWVLRQGDRIERTDRPGDPSLSIAEPVVLDRRGGLSVKLVEVVGSDA